MYFIIGWLAYVDSEAIRKSALTIGLRIVMAKSVKTLRMTRLGRLVLQRARSRGGARNK